MGGSLLDVENALGAIGQLDRATPVTLGDLVLSGPEVPDTLVMGGKQILVVHRLLGGGRVIDAVGNDPARLVLSGRFIGPLATRRARRVEAMRQAARVLSFSVADLAADVWIAEFSWAYQARGTICPYRLVLEREVVPLSQGASAGEGIDLDLRAGLGAITDRLAEMTEAGWIGTTMISTLAGQIAPVAQSLGAGGAVAQAQAALGKASALWQTASAVSRVPTAALAVSSPLSAAMSDLMRAGEDAGDALDNASPSDAGDLLGLSRNAGVAVIAVEAGSYARRARSLMSD
ncbi:hypothetical protein ACFFGF_06965 [Asaia lannensis]|uniref:Uncharacterized protein n=1 Tax=Asaia lannensis NBRC 102526 TaxID=1307926 RepID=A0ABT1CIY2_9PROT|nr:hypothetical protein [Asaia lannensis]MCO6160800.1 hypothetical protein [Asaia lannensis NBRC 102526]GBQ94567.1 hypothetical protein AA102526_0122 [Asaia lannensis NBRC 102526]